MIIAAVVVDALATAQNVESVGTRMQVLEAYFPTLRRGRRLDPMKYPTVGRGDPASLSNDGRFLYNASNKTLSEFDLVGNKATYWENVKVLYPMNGKPVALTDSQENHIRLTSARRLGPKGETLAKFGGTYLVVNFQNYSTEPIVLSAINPARRGLASNRIVGTLAKPRNNFGFSVFSVSSGARCWIALLTREKRRGAKDASLRPKMQFFDVVRSSTGAFSLKASKTFAPPWSAEFAAKPQDVDPLSKRALFSLDNQTYGLGSVATGKIQPIKLPLPQPLPGSYPMLRFASGRILCCYSKNWNALGGDLYMSSDAKTWKHLGPYLLGGMSFDRKILLLESVGGQVWRVPTSRL